MFSREPLDYSRLRRINGSFSWLDHRLIKHGYLDKMTPEEMLLYFFLVLVGDKNGVSFYNHDRIRGYLKMDVATYSTARQGLRNKVLIACEDIRVQVLQLPQEIPAKRPLPQETVAKRCPAPVSRSSCDEAKPFAAIFQELLKRGFIQ